MKLYWLPLLILGTHLSVFTPKALAFESEPITAIPIENIDTSTISIDKLTTLEDSNSQWLETSDVNISLEKGFHRRRFGNSRFRPGRFRGDIFFRNGSFHRTRFRHGEFRRDGIFFRHGSFQYGSFRHSNFGNVRFRHDGFRRHHFHHDRFRDDGFYRIRIH